MASTAGRVLGGKCNAAAKNASSGSNSSLLKWKPKSKVKGSASASASASPSSSSELGKFLGIPEASRSDTSKLISQFIKLNNRQNPGMKKDLLSEEKLKALLTGTDRVGIPEIVKLLSQQFVKAG